MASGVLVIASLLGLAAPVAAQTAVSGTTLQGQSNPLLPDAGNSGPVKLTQPATEVKASEVARKNELTSRYVPGEFERFVQRQAGNGTDGRPADIRRFGSDVINFKPDQPSFEPSVPVPQDYIIAAGDEILLSIWGSIDADLQLFVDRSGRISIPRVGTISVAGQRYGELNAVISKRVAQSFKNFQLSVTLGALRGVRVFVTGYAVSPGAYTIGSLSPITSALLAAGGPSSAGSFRHIELRRAGKVEAVFDLYDLILRGDKSADRLLQAGDVIHIPPVNQQVALLGSVNRLGIFELKPGETVGDVIAMSGGFSPVADQTRITVERLDERNALRVKEVALPAGLSERPRQGDIYRVLNVIDAALSSYRQNRRVRVEGEVARPGDYLLPPNSTITDALQVAGGFTDKAYVFGTEFLRESVRSSQQENYDRALRDLETEFARAGAQRTNTAEEATALQARATGTSRLIDRLREQRPTGRIVLQTRPDAKELPPLLLEDGDRLYIPSRTTTVGVFGSVFNSGSYLYTGTRTVTDYMRIAGGPTRGADQESVFVVRANGEVVSNLQGSTWWRSSTTLQSIVAEPGDTIFVPESINKTTFVQDAKDWTQILFQLGIGAAGIRNTLR